MAAKDDNLKLEKRAQDVLLRLLTMPRIIRRSPSQMRVRKTGASAQCYWGFVPIKTTAESLPIPPPPVIIMVGGIGLVPKVTPALDNASSITAESALVDLGTEMPNEIAAAKVRD